MTEKLTMESTAYEEPLPKSPAPRRGSTESKSSWSLALPFFSRSPSTKVKKSQVSAAELVAVPTPDSTAPTSDLRVQFEENERKLIVSYDSIISSLKQEIEVFKGKEIGYQKLIADVQLQKCNVEETIDLKNQEIQVLHLDLHNAVTTCQQFSQQVMFLQQEYSVLEANLNQCLFEKSRALTVIQEYEFQISSLQRNASSSSTLSGSHAAEHEKIAQLSVEIENMARERDNLRAQLEQHIQLEVQRQPPMMNAIFDPQRNGFEDKERQLVSNYEALIASIKMQVSEYQQKELKVQREMSDIQLQKCSFEEDAVKKGQQLETIRSEYQLIFDRVQYLEKQLSQSQSRNVDIPAAAPLEEKIEKQHPMEPNESANKAVIESMNREISVYKEKETASQQAVSDLQLLVHDLQSKGSQQEEGLVAMASESQALQEQLKVLQEECQLMEYKYQEGFEEKKQILERLNESENLCTNLQMSVSRLSADLSSTASTADQVQLLKAEVSRLNDESIRNVLEIERLKTQLSSSTSTITSLQQNLLTNESILTKKREDEVAFNAEYTRVLANAQYLEEQVNQMRYNFEYTESTYSAQMVQMQQEYRNMEAKCNECFEERDRLQRQYNESVSRCEELQSSTSKASADLAATTANLQEQIAELKADIERLTNEKNSALREVGQLQSQLSKANSNVSDLQQDLRKSESIATTKSGELAAITSQYQTALNNARYMEEQLTQMNYNYQYMDSAYSQQMMQMQQEYRNMEVRYYECVEERDRTQRQYNESVSRCEELQASTSTLTAQLSGLKVDIERLTNEKNSALREAEQLQSQLSKANSNVSDLQQDLRKSESIATTKSDELVAITSQYQTALNNARYMEEQLTQMNYNYQYMDSAYSQQMMQMQQEYRNMEVRCYESVTERDGTQRQYNESVSRCEKLQSTVSRLTGELSATNASKAELNSQVKNLNAEVDRLCADKELTTRELEQLMVQLTASKDTLSACKQQLTKSESDYQSALANAQSHEEQITQLRQEYQTMETYTNQLRQDYQTMDTFTNQVRQDYQSMESSYTMQISQLQQEYINMESTYCAQMNQLKEQYATMESSCTARMNQLKQEYGNVEYKYNQIQQNLVQMESKYKATVDEKNTINQRYNESESRGISLSSNISRLTAELSATSSQVKALQADTDRLFSEKYSIEEVLKSSRRHEEVLEQQRKNLEIEISSLQQQLQQEFQTKESMLTEYSYIQSELYSTVTNANILKNEYNELLRRYERLQRDNDMSKLETSSLRKDLEATEDRMRKYFTAPLQPSRYSSFPDENVENANRTLDNYSNSSIGQGVIDMSENVSQKNTIENANKLITQDDPKSHNLVGKQTAGQPVTIATTPNEYESKLESSHGEGASNFGSYSPHSATKANTSMAAVVSDRSAATSIFPSQNATATATAVTEESTQQPTTFGALSRKNSNRSSFNAQPFQTFNDSDESRAPQHYIENPLRSNDLGPASMVVQPSALDASFNQSNFNGTSESKKSANNSSMNLVQFGQESEHQNTSTLSQPLFGSPVGPLAVEPFGSAHANTGEQSNIYASSSTAAGTASLPGTLSQVADEQKPRFQALGLESSGGSFNNFSQGNANSISSHSIPDTHQNGFTSSQFPNSSSTVPFDNTPQPAIIGNSVALGGLDSLSGPYNSFNAPPFQTFDSGSDESRAPQQFADSLNSNGFNPSFISSQPSEFGAPFNQSDFNALLEPKKSANNSSLNLAQFSHEIVGRDQYQSNSTHSQPLFGNLSQKAMGPLSAEPFGAIYTNTDEQTNPFTSSSTTAGTASLFTDHNTAFKGLSDQIKDEQQPKFQALGLGSSGGSFNNFPQGNAKSISNHSILESSQFPNSSSTVPYDNTPQPATIGNNGVLGGLESAIGLNSNHSSFNAPPFQTFDNGSNKSRTPQHSNDKSLHSNDFNPSFISSQLSGFGAPSTPFNQSDFSATSESKKSANNSSLNLAQFGQESERPNTSTHSFGSLSQKAMGPLSAEPLGAIYTNTDGHTNPFSSSSTTAGTASLFTDHNTAFKGFGNQIKDEQQPKFQALGLGSSGGSFNNFPNGIVNSKSNHSIPDTQQLATTGNIAALDSSNSTRSSFNAPPFQTFDNGASQKETFSKSISVQPNGFGTPFAPFNQSDFGGLAETKQSAHSASLNLAQLSQKSSGLFSANSAVKVNDLTSDSSFLQGNVTEPSRNLSIAYGGEEEEQLDDLLHSPANFDTHSSARGSYGHSTSFNSPQVDKLDRSGNSNDLEDSMDDQHALNGFSSLSVSAGTGDFNNFGNSFGDFGSTGATSQNQQMFFSKSVQF